MTPWIHLSFLIFILMSNPDCELSVVKAWVFCSCNYHPVLPPVKMVVCAHVFVQVKSLSLRLEQEIHKQSLSQSELKMQNQQVLVLRSSEKQLKQELNHMLEMKQVLEKQNQELRRSDPDNKIKSTVRIKCRMQPSLLFYRW